MKWEPTGDAVQDLTHLAVDNLRGPDTAEMRLVSALLVRAILSGNHNTANGAPAYKNYYAAPRD